MYSTPISGVSLIHPRLRVRTLDKVLTKSRGLKRPALLVHFASASTKSPVNGNTSPRSDDREMERTPRAKARISSSLGLQSSIGSSLSRILERNILRLAL